MAGKDNLKPEAHKLTVAEQSAGGKKSAESRRRKSDLRKAIQAILDGTYKDKSGKEVSGNEALAIRLYKQAMDPEDKQSLGAAKLIIELSGQNISPEDKRIKKAEIKLLETKVELLRGDRQLNNEKELPMLWKALGADADDI